MSRTSSASSSAIILQEGELHKLTFEKDQGILDSFRYFSQDIGSQTEEKDVIPIIELSGALRTLTIENIELKRSLNLTRSTLQSEFHRRLTSASNQLYSRMNQRLEDVERSQRDRVEVVRRAFRTQLSDALSQMAAIYNDKMNKKLNRDRTFIESEESVKYTKKITDLTLKLKKCDIRIKELERQLTDIQENDVELQPTMILDSDSEMSEKIFEDDLGTPVESEAGDNKGDDDQKLREYTEQLVKRIEVLEKQNMTYQKENKDFEKENEKLSADLYSSNGILDVMRLEKQMVQERINQSDELHSKRILDLELMIAAEQNKIPIPKEEPKVEKPVVISVNVQKNMKEFPDMSKDVAELKRTIKEITEKDIEMATEITKIKGRYSEESKACLEQIRVLQGVNEKLRAEMFLRQQSQSSFKRLHSASVKYAKSNHPIGILPSTSVDKEPLSRLTHYSALPIARSTLPPINDIDNMLLNNFVEMNI